ncbi:MAG: caspase family protein [Deltaproteobacteria bacterium]|nr:caspase family protein [Deltaproteobacteria bacterium]MBN2672721.1 caspase family protein [Deltaproteobacteria bacterium]
MVFRTTIPLLLILLCSHTAKADLHRFALLIGNNAGGEADEQLRYAQRDAKKMYRLLTELGRFKKENTSLLLEETEPSVWKKLNEIETRANKLHAAGKKTLLLIYYSGHARQDALEMNGSRLPFDQLRRFLEKSRIDVRLAFVDSCHSGKLIATKGAKRGPSFEIKVNDEISSAGYAIITSSSQNELSQESRELRGAFFTHYLVSALRGSGDASHDGKVTLQEAYKYAYAKTLAQTVGSVGSGQHPMYHFQLKGQGEIVLTHTQKSFSAIEMPFIEKGRILLLDGLGQEVLAEAEASRNDIIRFSVPPGPYVIYIVKKSGAVRMAEIDVAPHEAFQLTADDFSTVALDVAVAKGGLFRVPEHSWSHKVGGFAIWRTGPLEGMVAAAGAGVHYRLQHVSGLQPTIRIASTTAPDVGLSHDYRDISIAAGLGYVFDVSFLYFRTEVLVGYEHMFQSTVRGSELLMERPHTSALAGMGSLGIEIPISAVYFFLDGGAGVRIFQVVDRGWVPRFEFQALLGAGIHWEKK